MAGCGPHTRPSTAGEKSAPALDALATLEAGRLSLDALSVIEQALGLDTDWFDVGCDSGIWDAYCSETTTHEYPTVKSGFRGSEAEARGFAILLFVSAVEHGYDQLSAHPADMD